ncbi:MAG: SpoIIIAH-like family protein [Syntrophomonas sp.]
MMIVFNIANRRLWAAGAAVLVFIIMVWAISSRFGTSLTPSSSVADQNKNLEKSIVSKLEEKRGQKGFFAEYRMERESMRGKLTEMLTGIVNDPKAEKAARQAASLRLVQISEDMEKEMKAENLIKSKGYSDCVVIFQEDATSVVVSASQLNSEQEADIRQTIGKTKNSGKLLLTLIEP